MIHLEVTVPDTTEALGTQAYGAGALLRWESGTVRDGPFVEGGTVPLVDGTTVYDVWDEAGTSDTWYRTRISNAGASSFSGYSIAFQASEQGLYLSPSQLRAFNVGVEFESDAPLLTLLDAATNDIRRVAGPMGAVTETHRSKGRLLMVNRYIEEIISITEGWDTLVNLDPLDYRVVGQSTIMRLHSGVTPRSYWRGLVTVTYLPPDDLASRQRVQLALVKQDLNLNPGLRDVTIGTFAESYSGAGVLNYQMERQIILSTLLSEGASIR